MYASDNRKLQLKINNDTYLISMNAIDFCSFTTLFWNYI